MPTNVNEFNSAPTILERIGMQVPLIGSAYQQAWAEQREDTAIQRQMADMKAAGLNPILAYSGGQGAASSAATQAAGNNSLLNGMINSANAHYYNKTKKEIAAENNNLKATMAKISTALELAKMFM